jgi:hypothetical protein
MIDWHRIKLVGISFLKGVYVWGKQKMSVSRKS